VDFKYPVTQYGFELSKGVFTVASGAGLANKFVAYTTGWVAATSPEYPTHFARQITGASVALFSTGIIPIAGLLDDDGDPLTVGLYFLSSTMAGGISKTGVAPVLLVVNSAEAILYLNCGVLDAPSDGDTYCRQDRDWVKVKGIETKELIESETAVTNVNTIAGRAFVACNYCGPSERSVVLADGKLGQEIMVADSAHCAATNPVSLGGNLSMDVALVNNGQVVTMVWIGTRWSVVSFGAPIPPPNALVDQNNMILEDNFGNTLTS